MSNFDKPKNQSNISKERQSILREVTIQEQKQKPELSLKTKFSFNFAACFLPVIYNFVYKRYGLAITFLILTAIPHIIDWFASDSTYAFFVYASSTLTVVLALFSGFTGNIHAYKVRDYDDEQDFLKSQRFWIPAFLIAMIIHALILPSQITGHYNTVQMIKLAQEKDILKAAIKKGAADGNLLGVNTVGDGVPRYFAEYLGKGTFDGENKIVMPNGVIYYIDGYMYECGSTKTNTYYEQKTSCATVKIDVNGSEGPNDRTLLNAKSITRLFNTKKIKDQFLLYVYNNDLAPAEASIEQYALKKFER